MRGCADAAARSIVVASAARDLCRTLRPTGLAKDTAARALRELHTANLVVATQRRTDTGVFDTGSYSVTTPAGLTIADATPRTRATPEPAAQLSLAIVP